MIGPGSLEGEDFPFSEIDPTAIDKIVSGIKSKSDFGDLKVNVMTLEKSAVDGRLRWAINAEGGGRTGLVYNAQPDGSNVTSPTQEATDITDCIQKAGTDVTKIQACTQ